MQILFYSVLLSFVMTIPEVVNANSFAFPLESLPLVLRNKTLKYFLYRDLQTLKRFSMVHVDFVKKMNELYQALLSSYYDTSCYYYGMSESDRALVDKIADLL